MFYKIKVGRKLLLNQITAAADYATAVADYATADYAADADYSTADYATD